MLAQRIVLLSGPLDERAATGAAARLMILDAGSADDVQLHLNCADGDLAASLMLADTVELVRCPVHATVLATLGGPPLAVAAACDRVRAHPNAQLVLRRPQPRRRPPGDDLVSAAAEHTRLVEQLCARLAAASGRAPGTVAEDLRHGRVLTAAEAVEYGLVDELVDRRR